MTFFPPPFHGALNATRNKCDVHRKIKIFRKSGRLVAATWSSGRGYFFVRRPNAHGNFYAKAMRERKKTFGGHHTLRCLGGTSRTRYFD